MPFPIVALATAVIPAISKWFGGTPEDKSTVGFDRYLSENQRPVGEVNYPSKEWLLAEARRLNWPADITAQISGTYNKSTGTFTHGDWRGAITSTEPQVVVELFKGAGEHFALASAAAFHDAPLSPSTSPAFQTVPQSTLPPAPSSPSSIIPGLAEIIAAQQKGGNVGQAALNAIIPFLPTSAPNPGINPYQAVIDAAKAALLPPAPAPAGSGEMPLWVKWVGIGVGTLLIVPLIIYVIVKSLKK